jgi:hypothetical protein
MLFTVEFMYVLQEEENRWPTWIGSLVLLVGPGWVGPNIWREEATAGFFGLGCFILFLFLYSFSDFFSVI